MPGWFFSHSQNLKKKKRRKSKWSEMQQLFQERGVCSQTLCSGFLPSACVRMAVCRGRSEVAPPRLSSSGVSVCTAQSGRRGRRVMLPLHHARFLRFRVSLRVFGVAGVVYFGVCTLSAVAARHGDPEGVRVLQFHLVLIRHFDEGTPCKGVTETCAKPVKKP